MFQCSDFYRSNTILEVMYWGPHFVLGGWGCSLGVGLFSWLGMKGGEEADEQSDGRLRPGSRIQISALVLPLESWYPNTRYLPQTHNYGS